MRRHRRFGTARRVEAPAPKLMLSDGLTGRRIAVGVSKSMRNAPTETWVIHPVDDPGAPVLQVMLFRSDSRWAAWTGSFTRAADRVLAEQVAAARSIA